MPLTVGQEFGGFAANISHAASEVERTWEGLRELNLGASAVGTGLNAGTDYTLAAIGNLSALTALPLRPAADRFRVTQSMGDVLACSGALRRLAVELGKVASDLRLLSMGPRAGIAGASGNFELNVMMPVIAWNALHATRILREAMRVLTTRCVSGIRVDAARCHELLDRSTALATALSSYIGYAATADIAKASIATGRPIRDLVRERRLVPDDQLDAILSAEAMTSPGVPGRPALPAAASPSRARTHDQTGTRGARPGRKPARR